MSDTASAAECSAAITAPHPPSCRCAECARIRAEDFAELQRLRSWERRQNAGPQPGDIEIAVNRRRAGVRIVGVAA